MTEEFKGLLHEKDTAVILRARLLVKDITEIMDEFEEAGKSYTVTHIEDLKFVFNALDEQEYNKIRKYDLRTYWKIKEVGQRIQDEEYKLQAELVNKQFDYLETLKEETQDKSQETTQDMEEAK